MSEQGAIGRVDVVVIGAGQAGLSAGYHLQRRGFVPGFEPAAGEVWQPVADLGDAVGTFVILDSEDGPGGAWRHRWPSLRMDTVNGIYDLPGMALPDVDLGEPSAEAIPRYFADYERAIGLEVIRPVRVSAVRPADSSQPPRFVTTFATRHKFRDSSGASRLVTNVPTGHERRGMEGEASSSDDLLVDVTGGLAGTLVAGAVINATGTWTKPFWPRYPGQETFRGRQLHVTGYESAEDFMGQHVLVVGGGISAIQLLDEISRITTTTWFTRREPLWRDDEFDEDAGRRAVALVEERVRQGLPPQSVVSVTGLIRTPQVRAAEERGVLVRQPMFTRIEPDGVRMADGTFQRADAILWATGFRAALDHLRPLRLREPGGGITMEGTEVAGEPRVHLIGYGPSSSTVGANRAGRDAVNRLVRTLPKLVTSREARDQSRSF